MDIDVTEAKKRLDASDWLLLDVREVFEWDAGHAPNAQFVPLGSLDVNAFDSGQHIAVICRSGGRSASATEQLRAAGVDAVNVAGGMTAWASAGFAVLAEDGEAGMVV